MFVFSVSGWFPAGATISQPYPHLQLLRQTSPGNPYPPSRLCPPHIHPCLPCRYRTLKIYAFSSRHECLLCDGCSSGQRFAPQALPAVTCGFLQIPPHGGHPCRSANCSPCRVSRGLAPPSGYDMPVTHKKANPALKQGLPFICNALMRSREPLRTGQSHIRHPAAYHPRHCTTVFLFLFLHFSPTFRFSAPLL